MNIGIFHRWWWRELKSRLPAICSILRDGTVVYNANIENGTVYVTRNNSVLQGSSVTSDGDYCLVMTRVEGALVKNCVFTLSARGD
jgi:hypothetical protein